MQLISALSIEALLSGLAACGMPDDVFRRRFNLEKEYSDPSVQLPFQTWHQIWTLARTLDDRVELPTLVALAIPFGRFGMIDYLAGSSATVGGGLQALADHFSVVDPDLRLELAEVDGNSHSFRILGGGHRNSTDDEFTTVVILNRFRQVTSGRFQPLRVHLPHSIPKSDVREGILQAPVFYGDGHPGFDMTAGMLQLEQTPSDPGLHKTLVELAKRLSLGSEKTPHIEIAIRARLRDLLPLGRATASDVSKAIGLSERTLHRRLSDVSVSFQEVLDGFRVEEADRLLSAKALPLSQIAQQLGYSDQASWSRAYKRVRGVTPSRRAR